MERFDIDKTIEILGLDMRADMADEGRDFDVACRIAVEKLRKCKAYEDTNLTPEQIVEIDKLYRKKCEELERLKKYLPAFRIGDTAYLVDFDAGTFDKSVVNGIVSRVDGDTAKFDYDSDLLDFCDTDIGVCVFRSETEAQEALERMVKK